MPPKKSSGDSKKVETKKKEKVIEDKTFGLKNKKGAQTKKYIEGVRKQVIYGDKNARQIKQIEDAKKKTKKKDDLEDAFKLIRPVLKEVSLSKGADPKSVVCQFFKQGQCKKGAKCKFSHDLTIERKSEKRNIYQDEAAEDSMENWDEAMLEDVINKKHGESNKSKQQTKIICKHFLEALENSKYGWFWQCPSGDKCIYKHALPPGFVLKKDKKKEDKGEEISLEELIEKERAALAWKEKKRKEKSDKENKEKAKKKADYTAGRVIGISGREMFEFNPDIIAEDDEEADTTHYVPIEDEEETEEVVQVHDVDASVLAKQATDVDDSGTICKTSDRKGDPYSIEPQGAAAAAPLENGDAVPVDESLFTGDDLGDELDDLELSDS